jgi:hypothetical protein
MLLVGGLLGALVRRERLEARFTHRHRLLAEVRARLYRCSGQGFSAGAGRPADLARAVSCSSSS